MNHLLSAFKSQFVLALILLHSAVDARSSTQAVPAPYVRIVSAGTPVRMIGQAYLAPMKHVTVSLTEQNGNKTPYSGVPLVDILRRLGVIKGEHVKGQDLSTYLLVAARDQYKVVFGLGEVDSAVSGRTIILADAIGKTPLNFKLGPYRIVVADDLKQARCVRMVSTIHIVRQGK